MCEVQLTLMHFFANLTTKSGTNRWSEWRVGGAGSPFDLWQNSLLERRRAGNAGTWPVMDVQSLPCLKRKGWAAFFLTSHIYCLLLP